MSEAPTTVKRTTLPELFALASGVDIRRGAERCWYCGAACAPICERHIRHKVKKTCTIHQYARAPDSEYVCDGCWLVLDERAKVLVFGEGEEREGTRVRSYSWVVTERAALAYTKAHIVELRRICLDPPSTPFGIVLSNSGQKHLLYMGHVNLCRDPLRILLEDETITYSVGSLRARLELSGMVCAAIGKPALVDCEPWRVFRACADRYADGVDVASSWLRIRSESLSRLAAWLTDRKEVCSERHPESA